MYAQPPASNQFGQPYGGAHGGYGAAQSYGDVNEMAPFVKKKPQTNIVTVIACWFVPVLLFSAVFSLQSFSMHYENPKQTKLLCELVLIAVIAVGLFSGLTWYRKLTNTSQRDPLWVTFLFVTCLAGWIFAMVFGQRNFVKNMSPFKDIVNLNYYHSVSPASYRGQQLMDAGRIEFVHDAKLDLQYSMGFKNLDTYCVAPVSIKNGTSGPLSTYDFWAVGVNCCSGHAPDFHCGEYSNINAHSGLRLMRDDLRAYFRLAVQQAEAAYNIHAQHPVFMYWMEDPANEVNAYQDAAYKWWLVATISFLAGQLAVVILALLAFPKVPL